MKANGIPVSFSHFPYCNKKVRHPYLQNLVPGALDWQRPGTGSPTSPLAPIRPLPGQEHVIIHLHAAPPPPHALHSHRRRAESAERGSPRDQKASEASPLGPKPEPLARNTVEPQTGPSRQRPAFHLRRMSPRRITDQKTNPEVAATLLSSLGPSVLTKHQPSQLHVFCL